jgi:hypothetical protein
MEKLEIVIGTFAVLFIVVALFMILISFDIEAKKEVEDFERAIKQMRNSHAADIYKRYIQEEKKRPLKACGCVNVEMGTYANTVLLDYPECMQHYRKKRIQAGYQAEKIQVDACIAEEIKDLWSKGVITMGCCCGHNKQQSMVNVDENSIKKMLALGYIQNHPDPERKDTFRLKTAG